MARIALLSLALAMICHAADVTTLATITLAAPFANGEFTEFGDVGGVDSQGRTTYVIDNPQGLPQDTRVQASDHVYLTLSQTGFNTLPTTTMAVTAFEEYDCDLESNGNAVCSSFDADSQMTTTTIPSVSVGTLILEVVSTASAPIPAPSKPNSSPTLSRSMWGFAACLGLGVYQIVQ
ncbi:hypothetical protein B0H16DRAFT_1522101 [Mycena metata]|uniref:Uncharacterized protein n=1 Tax=Mycena metata TaxID=1033252 RepID=A0AAD7JKT5_9AGAR|nr:hypothetical protein B0H16DRAFT_1522101 [Mycena metata]